MKESIKHRALRVEVDKLDVPESLDPHRPNARKGVSYKHFAFLFMVVTAALSVIILSLPSRSHAQISDHYEDPHDAHELHAKHKHYDDHHSGHRGRDKDKDKHPGKDLPAEFVLDTSRQYEHFDPSKLAANVQDRKARAGFVIPSPTKLTSDEEDEEDEEDESEGEEGGGPAAGGHPAHSASKKPSPKEEASPTKSASPEKDKDKEHAEGGGGGKKAKKGARTQGMGTGATKHIPMMNEKDLSKTLTSVSSEAGGFAGSFAMNQKRRPVDADLPFPRKKLRNKLTHYSLGKVGKKMYGDLPKVDPVREMLEHSPGLKAGSCAIVGNGGSLLLYDLGPEIDRHDYVIRMNRGPTKGFERHVGSRTTFRLVNSRHTGFRELREEVVLQHITTPEALAAFFSARSKDPGKFEDVYAIDPDFHEFAMTFTDKGVLSNGFYGIVFASSVCHTVSVFGFMRDWKGKTKYHYYNDEEPDGAQSFRDLKEAYRLEWYISNRTESIAYAEPCMGSYDQPCQNCAVGSQCILGRQFPVPAAGYCYKMRSPGSPHLPDVGCFHKCLSNSGMETTFCPGGKRSFCPSESSYDPHCMPVSERGGLTSG